MKRNVLLIKHFILQNSKEKVEKVTSYYKKKVFFVYRLKCTKHSSNNI